VFDRIGVFSGTFSLTSAQAIAIDGELDEWAVLDHLGALVDKSLVIADGGANARYRLLETTRAFALERLAARGETHRMLRRHAQAVLSVFEHFYRTNLDGLPVTQNVAAHIADLDNLRGAMQWAMGPDGDVLLACQIAGACIAGRGFMPNAGLGWEGSQWCQALRHLVTPALPAEVAARFWLACAEPGSAASQEAASQDAQRAIDLYHAAGDQLGEFLARGELSSSLILAGRFDEARASLMAHSALLKTDWPIRMRAIHENLFGLCLSMGGHNDEARQRLTAYLRLSREMRSAHDELTAASLLADIDVVSGRPQEAVSALREAIDRLEPALANGPDGMVLRNFGTALLEAGLLEEAETVFRRAAPVLRRAQGTSAFVLHDLATLLGMRGDLDAAARVAAYAESVYAAPTSGEPPG
jgi:tetratricopeptide (TPR) repeat protein